MFYIKEVKTKKEQKEFLDFPLKIYKGNKYFVPPIYIDEKKIFSKHYVYSKTCDSKFFLVYDKKNKVVGRIQGIIQHASNEKWHQRRVRFTRFDCIDNQEVAHLLFNEIEKYAKDNDLDEVVGPLGYSDLEREGLLIEGFEQVQTFEEQYNYDYYQRLIENEGYGKEIDWLEHQLRLDEAKVDRTITLSQKILDRFKLKYVTCKSINDYINKYSNQFFELLDISYEHIYGTVPFTKEMKENMIDGFKLLVNKNYLGTIVDENDKIVAFSIAFPNIGKDLIKSQGHLTIPTLINLLITIKKPNAIDLGLIGVAPKYQNLGVSSALLGMVMKSMLNNGIEYAETNLNLEDNYHIIQQWQNFKSIQHKRRRCFIKEIKKTGN